MAEPSASELELDRCEGFGAHLLIPDLPPVAAARTLSPADSEGRHKGCPLRLDSGKVVVSAAAPRRVSSAAVEQAIPAPPQSAAGVEKAIPPRRGSAAGMEKAIPARRRSAVGVEKAIPAPPQSAAAVENAIPTRRVGATAAGNRVPAPSRGSRTRQKVFRVMSGACASRASATFLNCIGLLVVQ